MDFFRILYGGAVGSSFTGQAVTASELDKLVPRLVEAERWLRKGMDEGRDGFGWLELPCQDTSSIVECGSWLGSFDHILQVGIGGSALGNLMLRNALVHPYYNEISREVRKGPSLHVADNVDPRGSSSILDVLDIERTAIVVVSKSGSTAETMANFLFFYHRLELTLGRRAADHVLVITDEQKGSLKAFADETGCRMLIIPSGVGGRYSVLSPVGMVSAQAMGMNVEDILQGAAAMDGKLRSSGDLYSNPAWIMAALHYLHYRKGRNMDVLMPYSDRLEDFVEWYAQLSAESLGKNGKGFTPIRAMGSIDQHSQVQMYTEGPDDKLFTIIEVGDTEEDLIIPRVERASLQGLSYLHDKKMGEMLSFEARATAASISRSGKPVLYLQMEDLSARIVGGLIFFFEYVVALTGRLMEIDPFDQPGVEQGKRYTYGYMGREGFDEYRKEAEELFLMLEKEAIDS